MMKRRTVLTHTATVAALATIPLAVSQGALAQGRKDSIVLGMALEPPGPRSHGRRRVGHRRNRPVQHPGNAHQDQFGRQGDAAAGGKLGNLARPQDLHLQAAQRREVPERRALQCRGGPVLVPARGRRQEHQQGQTHFRQPGRAGDRRSHGGAAEQGDRPGPAVPPGPGHSRDRRAEKRGHQCHQADRHRSLQAGELEQGLDRSC